MSRSGKRRSPPHLATSPAPSPLVIEASVPGGLEDIVTGEVLRYFPHRVCIRDIHSGSLLFDYRGALSDLLHLRTVLSLYLVAPFAVARPRALLGHGHLRRIVADMRSVLVLWPQGSFRTVHLSAAGSGSSVMQRFVQEIARDTGLRIAASEGNLQLRVRPSTGDAGWDVLIRLSPRPLSTRPWRVCAMPGAVNAAVGAAMVLLTEPADNQVFLNPACGSGTLLVERAEVGPAARMMGCDIVGEALACAGENIEASGYDQRVEIHHWDARQLPLPDRTVDALCLDLPFGHLVGDHRENRNLYPHILRETARVARPGALCCLLAHQGGLVDDALTESALWRVERRSRVHTGGLIPSLFVLRKRRR